MAFAQRTALENEPIPFSKKGPTVSLRNKSAALGDVKNIAKCVGIADKTSALERQRAAAERLSKGYSVVKCAPGADKENASKIVKESKPSISNGYGRENSVSIKNNLRNDLPKAIKKPSDGRLPVRSVIAKTTSLISLPTIQENVKQPVAIVNQIEEALTLLKIDDDVDDKCKDEFLLGIYAKDIYRNLKRLEAEQAVRSDYLSSGHRMTENMRAVLVDWMFEVQQAFELLHETAQTAIAMLDRYLQDVPLVRKDELQLIAVSCIFLAAKYEETYPPGVSDLVLISADAYPKSRILRMEKTVFKQLEFNIGRPTPVQFLKRYCRAAGFPLLQYTLSKYFVDLALIKYQFCHLPPSLLAAAALTLSIFLVNDNCECVNDAWTPSLTFYSGYLFNTVEPIVPKLARLIYMAPGLKQQSVQKMYASSEKYLSVSTRSELKSEKLRVLAKAQKTGS